MRYTLRLSLGLAVLTVTAMVPAVVRAQLDLPRPSPSARVSQVIGLTEITVEYGRPAVKGRKIWGGLVPYDKLWRTGANQATKITFSRDTTFGGQNVPAGSYALFTIPTKSAWTVILNRKADQPGAGAEYKAELDQVRVQASPKAVPMRERLTFQFADFSDDKGVLDLEWEKLRLSIPIKVDTDAHALANIKKTLDGTWRTYAQAARYQAETKKDYDAALHTIDQSLALNEDWFNLWIKATIVAAKGNRKEAIALGEKSYELGKKAEMFFLESEIKKTLADWKRKR